jgi:hypothetical protein
MINIVGQFPLRRDMRELSRRERNKIKPSVDEYFVYRTSEEDLVFNWCDKWFSDVETTISPRYFERVWSVKYVDEETATHLYDNRYNPFSICISSQYKRETHFAVKAMIHSIDDSSFGVWFKDLSLEDAKEIRDKVAAWLDTKKTLNGKEFFAYCKEIGATDFDTN